MFKQPSIPSLHNDIFVLRDRIVSDLVMRKKINEINYRSVPMQKVESLQEHNRNMYKFENANFQNLRLKNLSLDISNQRLLNKLKNISSKKSTPPSKNHGRSFSMGVEALKNKQIDIDNKKFLKKLVRIYSPLSKSKMDKDFEKHIKDEKIMRRIKDYERGFSLKKIKHIKEHLPKILKTNK